MVVMVAGLKPHCMAELSDEPAESFTYEYVFAIHFDLLIPSLRLQRMTGALCLRCKIPGLEQRLMEGSKEDAVVVAELVRDVLQSFILIFTT